MTSKVPSNWTKFFWRRSGIVLGGSLVFMITAGSGHETLKKTRPSSFFNFIFIFSRLGHGFKNLQKIILPEFQSANSQS
jgi:hypothetical protein